MYDYSLAIKGQYSSGGGDAGYKAKDTYVGPDGKDYHMWYDESGGIHKTDVPARSPSGTATNFEPPNNAERESAEALIKKDDVLSDLSGNDKKVAAEILASDIRQLQAAGFDYADASVMATEKLKKKIKDVPDWFSSHTEIDLGGGGLADNEFLVNGTVYIREDDGSIRTKD